MEKELAGLLNSESSKSKFKIEGTSFPCSLEEKENDMIVQISHCTDNRDVVVLKCPDNHPDFFKEIYQKICDYVILLPERGGEELAIIFCELKKSETSKNYVTAKKQLKCSIPMLDYIVSGLRHHKGIISEQTNIKRSYAVFFERENSAMDKQVGHASKLEKQTRKDCIEYEGIQINVFIGRKEISLRQLTQWSRLNGEAI